MKWTIATLIAGVVSLVAAQQDAGVYFTNPVLGTVLNAGTPTSIQWTVTNSNVSTIDSIELRNGDSQNLALVQTISTQPVQLSAGKYDWQVPSNLTTDTSYVILASNAAGTSYTAYFTIMGLAPGVTANDFATTTAAVTPVSTLTSESVPAMTTIATAVTTPDTSASASASASGFNVVQANVVSGSNNLKAGIAGVAGAVMAAALLA